MSSWIPSWPSRGKYSALPTGNEGYAGRTTPSRKRLLQAGAAVVFVLALLALGGMRSGEEPPPVVEEEKPAFELDTSQPVEEAERPSLWGMTEEQGWTPEGIEGLVDLGETAEAQYRLGFTPDEEGAQL